jgi:hypothetical protein
MKHLVCSSWYIKAETVKQGHPDREVDLTQINITNLLLSCGECY